MNRIVRNLALTPARQWRKKSTPRHGRVPLSDRIFDLSAGGKAKLALFTLVGWYCYDMAIDNHDMKVNAFNDPNPYREVKNIVASKEILTFILFLPRYSELHTRADSKLSDMSALALYRLEQDAKYIRREAEKLEVSETSEMTEKVS